MDNDKPRCWAEVLILPIKSLRAESIHFSCPTPFISPFSAQWTESSSSQRSTVPTTAFSISMVTSSTATTVSLTTTSYRTQQAQQPYPLFSRPNHAPFQQQQHQQSQPAPASVPQQPLSTTQEVLGAIQDLKNLMIK